ncbi:MAG: hypothetical protein B6229_00350 [Spirochaetaceae bacterium 4572_7]|nr:MAG: hypothetical protein B6229_00350 [Spirochaetaceae bacterium 4572_7]
MLEKLKSRVKGLQIDPAKFYKIGVWCFGIIAIFNTMNYINELMSGLDLNYILVISKGASLVFNYALWGFFYYLKGTIPPNNLEKGTLADMKSLIEEKEVKK